MKFEVTKNGTIPKISKLSFKLCPLDVNSVNRKINPVKVRYLHLIMNLAIGLKKGTNDR